MKKTDKIKKGVNPNKHHAPSRMESVEVMK